MAKLYFYYSSMNAGKSTNLLQSSYNYKERGMNTLVLAPMMLITRQFIESLYTRMYEFDLTYKGKYQPIMQLKAALPAVPGHG